MSKQTMKIAIDLNLPNGDTIPFEEVSTVALPRVGDSIMMDWEEEGKEIDVDGVVTATIWHFHEDEMKSVSVVVKVSDITGDDS